MKLHSVKVNQWRKFARPTGVDDLSDGLNVLTAPNEIGKSTLVGALRTALFTKHTVGGNDIKALCTTGTSNSPIVEVVFEIDGERYTLRKRFLNGKYARLTMPNGVELTGEQAESKLEEVLDFSFPRKGKHTDETMGLWSLLWLDQGAGAGPIEAADRAQRTVMGALEDTVGNLLGGEQGRRLPKRVKEKLLELVTEKTEAPTGRYNAAIQRVDILHEELEALNRSMTQLEADLRDYEQASAELEQRKSSSTESDIATDIEGAQARLEQLLQLESQLEGAQGELGRRQERLEAATQSLESRNELVEAIAQLAEEIEEAEARIGEADEEEKRLQGLLKAARSTLTEENANRSTTTSEYRQAERIAQAAQLSQSFLQLEQDLERVVEAERRVAELSARISSNRATDDSVSSLDGLMDQLRNCQGAMSAVATLVDFDLEDEAESKISLPSGVTLPRSGEPLELIDPTNIRIEGIGSLTIRPQVEDAAVLQRNLDEAREKLASELESIGAETFKMREC
jgi:DNA repair exonuclease SbcCD ATPase subunit